MTAKQEPTREQFDAYRAMFTYFNKVLFADKLPEIVLNFSRHARSYGFFAPERWGQAAGGDVRTHELSLNPDHLTRDPRETASTLVHEMCHLWQQELGTPPRRGYHDRQWADQMEKVGLMPSSTGEPGGKRVGPRMTHYIIENGAFAKAFAAMPATFLLPWRSGIPELAKGGAVAPKKKDPSKVKYTCEGCGTNVWGKIGLRIQCSICEEEFEEVA
jgi:predicted SprT family Zn-dependent metalloprotease